MQKALPSSRMSDRKGSEFSPLRRFLALPLFFALLLGATFADAQINVPTDQPTIQAAVNASLPGGTIIVAPGTYAENVIINKSLTLLSSGGADVTTINGFAATPLELGTIVIDGGVNGVTIGGMGKGFTIKGFDAFDSPGLELAAIYFRQVHNNITIRGNKIVADGEAAILTEFGQAVNNLTIEGNTISGKTFVGSSPAGCGNFQDQYDVKNYPRGLVTISTGTGVLFSNNIITGTAGGPSTVAGCETSGQGRSLIEIFGDGELTSGTATICGNNFAGTVYRTSSSLVADGSSISVKNNTFNSAGLVGTNTRHLYIDNNALNGATPGTIEGVASMNTFLSEGYYVTGGNRIYKNSAQAAAVGTPIAANSMAIADASCATCLGTTPPDLKTAPGDSRYPAGQTSVSGIFQNSGPVIFNSTNCPGGTLNWNGSNGSSGNSTNGSLSLPTTTLGMVTYSATCTIGECKSEATTLSITTIQDNRCGPNNQNVKICYYGVTQCVSPSIAARYMRLGATMGACGSGGGNNLRIGVEETVLDAPFALSVKSYPNPTQGSLTVEVMSKITGSAQMQVLDLTGRAVQQRTEQLLEGRNEVKFDLTAQPSGTYLIRATDALNRQGVVRVSKQ